MPSKARAGPLEKVAGRKRCHEEATRTAPGPAEPHGPRRCGGPEHPVGLSEEITRCAGLRLALGTSFIWQFRRLQTLAERLRKSIAEPLRRCRNCRQPQKLCLPLKA